MKQTQFYRIYTLIMSCIFIISCNKGKETQYFASLQETKLPPLEKNRIKRERLGTMYKIHALHNQV